MKASNLILAAFTRVDGFGISGMNHFYQIFIYKIFLVSPRCLDDTKWFNGLTEFECDYKCRENSCYCPKGWQRQNPGDVIVAGREEFNPETDIPSLEEPFGWPARINVVGTGMIRIYTQILRGVSFQSVVETVISQ